MINREKALEYLSELIDSENYDKRPHNVPECVAVMRQRLTEAEEAWIAGKKTWALHCVGQAAAFGVVTLEQCGEDIREEDPGEN